MINDILFLALIFFCIAAIYSSAGFGGGSSYLAALSLFGLEFVDLRMIALICNIVVVTSSVILFSKSGYVKWKKILPLILLSVPLAFLGGSLKLEARFFYLLLGASLLISSIVMILDKKVSQRKLPKFSNGIIGGSIGFLSGMVGIGGGIFLSPILHLTKWDVPKVIAATSAGFILVNSIAGLTGQIYTNGFHLEWRNLVILIIAVICGGQIGVRMTIFKFNPVFVKRITAIVILIVAIRLLLKYV